MRLDRIAFLCCALSLSCADPPAAPPDGTPATVAPSTRGNLRFKGPERLTADFSAALALPADAVCTELGQYQCAGLVHHVALGGVDPYGAGLYERSGGTAITTPLVVERMAWAACARRVDMDLKDPQAAAVFRGVPLDGARLADPGGAEVRALIAQVTQRALQRDPHPIELTRFAQLARDIEKSGEGEPASAFMKALCFAVLSSTESVFY